MAGRPRKRGLSPLAGRILWQLAEAGEETLAVLTHLRHHDTPPAAFVVDLQAGLNDLLRLGLVELRGMPGRADAASCIVGITSGDVHEPGRLVDLTLILTHAGRRALVT